MKPHEDTGTRSRILDAALSLFSQKSYEAAGVQEIADNAGIAKPALYYYFGNKQGLLGAIAAEYGSVFLDITRRTCAYRHDLVMNLRGLLRKTLAFSAEHPHFWRLMESLFSAAPETESYAAGKELRNDLVSCLIELFAAAAKDHGNMRGRQKIYGETFFALLQSCAILALNGEFKMDESLQFKIIHQFMHGIFS
jgi:TetR/AcrR family transcriptional regulator